MILIIHTAPTVKFAAPLNNKMPKDIYLKHHFRSVKAGFQNSIFQLQKKDDIYIWWVKFNQEAFSFSLLFSSSSWRITLILDQIKHVSDPMLQNEMKFQLISLWFWSPLLSSHTGKEERVNETRMTPVLCWAPPYHLSCGLFHFKKFYVLYHAVEFLPSCGFLFFL